jgi:DNA-binding response OmpR family regulator
MAVRLLVDRPALPAALQDLGVALTDAPTATVAIVRAAALRDARCCPSARVLAIAHDEAGEIAALAAGVDDATCGGDALVALRAKRLFAHATIVTLGSLRIDRLARTASCAGRTLALLPREFALLDLLARDAGSTVGHAALYRGLFGLRFDPGTNVLAVHVSRVRRALAASGMAAMLRTDRGRGYRLVPEDDAGTVPR